MRAVLYICHGSRVKAGQQAALAFIEQTMEQVEAPIQEACFLELAEPSIAQGIARCVERGATEIVAVPFLLLQAGHAIYDIPAALKSAMKDYPATPLYYGDPIGVHEKMVDVLIDRFHEKATDFAEDASILIVGRGSSDPATPRDFREIVRLFQEKTGLSNVSVGYLAACEPKFDDQLEALLNKRPSQLFVLPYLLFTGILLKSMERKVIRLQTDTEIHLCPELGYDPIISSILKERVQEAAERKSELYVPDYAG